MDDIREAYWMSDIFVAPLFTGSGLQNKILEAMACKIPVVTTSIVNYSLRAEVDKSISIAENKSEFTQEIMSLLQMSDNEKQRRVDTAYNFVTKTYSWTENNNVLIKAFQNI